MKFRPNEKKGGGKQVEKLDIRFQAGTWKL